MLVTQDTIALLLPEIYQVAIRQYAQRKDKKALVFPIKNSKREYEEHVQMGAMLPAVKWDGSISFDTFKQGYTKKLTHVKYTRGIQIQHEWMLTEQYNVMNTLSASIADAIADRERLEFAAFWDNSFTTTEDSGDGKALFATNHPSKADASYSVSNYGTTALSYTELLTARRIMKTTFKNDRGTLIQMDPSLVIVPTNLEGTIAEIADSLDKPATGAGANWRGANFMQGIKYLVLDDLTDTTNWWYVDPEMMERFLVWYYLLPAVFSSTDDFMTMATMMAGAVMFSRGAFDPRFGYGEEVT